LPKLALGAAAALAAISLSPGSAQAFVVTVNSVQYDVTTFTGSYASSTSKFETAANDGVMPWWGDSNLAKQFATAVGSSFGNPNNAVGFDCDTTCGPIFGYVANLGGFPNNFGKGWIRLPDGNIVDLPIQPQTASFTWAQVALVAAPAPAPGPLPLFGAGAAFGFSRQLRKRIKLEPNAMGSALPQA
jgi:hypothetical protein